MLKLTYTKAIETNLLALQTLLTAALRAVDDGLEAAGQGNQNGAVGAILPTEESLKLAGGLVQAILALHRQR